MGSGSFLPFQHLVSSSFLCSCSSSYHKDFAQLFPSSWNIVSYTFASDNSYYRLGLSSHSCFRQTFSDVLAYFAYYSCTSAYYYAVYQDLGIKTKYIFLIISQHNSMQRCMSNMQSMQGRQRRFA